MKICRIKIDFLLKIYNIACEIIYSITDNKYIPTKNTLIDFIEISNLIDNPNSELIELQNRLINYTKLDIEEISHSSVKIVDCIKKMIQHPQFLCKLNNYLYAKKNVIINLPMPIGFNNEKLKKLYSILVEYNYIENKKMEYFVKLFEEGLDENIKFKWLTKYRYVFNFFILELYQSSYQKLDKIVKNNIKKIFYDRKGKPLKVRNIGDKDYDKKNIRNDIKSIIAECLKIA